MYIFNGVQFQQHSTTSVKVSFGELPPLLVQDLLPKEIIWLRNRISGSQSENPSSVGDDCAFRDVPTISVRSQNKLETILVRGGFAQRDTRYSDELTPPELAEYAALTARKLPATKCLEKRRETVVAVYGINRVSLAILRVLCASGVSKFVIDDREPFDAVDLLSDLHYPGIGPTRAQSVEAMLRKIAPGAMVLSPHNYVSFGILSNTRQSDFVTSTYMSIHSLPHLVVTPHGGSTIVGPMLDIYAKHELSCFASELGMEDELDSGEVPSDFTSRITKTPLFSSVDASSIGAFAAGQILNYLDGVHPVTASTRAVFQHGTALAELAPIEQPFECRCGRSAQC